MNKFTLGFLVFGLLFLNSCIVPKKVIYVNDMLPDSGYTALEAPPLHIQKGDRLSIVVSAKTPELAVPFNTQTGTYMINENGEVSTGAGQTLSERGYLVNDNGQIDFPILGGLSVLGLSLDEVKELVRNKLASEGLITEPIVRVELLNLKINVMGEITRVGVLDVPDGKINLIEAISRAGGLTTNGAPDKVAVIREENGERKIVLNDIRSKEIFNSSTYHLRQNDIVYVMPIGARLSAKQETNLRYVSSAVGFLTLFFTLLNYLKD